MLDSILADEGSTKGRDYMRRVTPFWLGSSAKALVGLVLVGGNPYSATTLNWGVAILLWGVCAFWMAVLPRDWRKARSEWVVR